MIHDWSNFTFVRYIFIEQLVAIRVLLYFSSDKYTETLQKKHLESTATQTSKGQIEKKSSERVTNNLEISFV